MEDQGGAMGRSVHPLPASREVPIHGAVWETLQAEESKKMSRNCKREGKRVGERNSGGERISIFRDPLLSSSELTAT